MGALQGTVSGGILQNDRRQNELRTTESGAYITERVRYNLQKAMRITETEQRQNMRYYIQQAM